MSPADDLLLSGGHETCKFLCLTPLGVGVVKRIVILHDNGVLSGTLPAILAGEGYRVDHIPFGEQSLDFLRLHRPDLLILDADRPWREVLALLSRIKADFHLWDTPVLVFTRAAEAWDKAAALRRQNCIVLPRNADRARVVEAVERSLAQASSSPKRRAS